LPAKKILFIYYLGSDMAVIFTGEDEQPPSKMSVIVQPYGGAIQYISYNNPNRDPLIYPLLFPNAESGFQFNIPNARTNLTNEIIGKLNDFKILLKCIKL
jgi:hypothetical protein